jgi:hypothetical protein
VSFVVRPSDGALQRNQTANKPRCSEFQTTNKLEVATQQINLECRRILQSEPTLQRSDFGNFLNAQARRGCGMDLAATLRTSV